MQAVKSRALGRELKIPAHIGRLRDAREWAADAAEEFGLDRDGCFQVKLAVSEAVTNAIMHGSGSDRDLIQVQVRGGEDALVFEIRDPGRQAGASSFNRLADGGRGLELVSLVMDEMQLTRGEHGSVLRFVKRR